VYLDGKRVPSGNSARFLYVKDPVVYQMYTNKQSIRLKIFVRYFILFFIYLFNIIQVPYNL